MIAVDKPGFVDAKPSEIHECSRDVQSAIHIRVDRYQHTIWVGEIRLYCLFEPTYAMNYSFTKGKIWKLLVKIVNHFFAHDDLTILHFVQASIPIIRHVNMTNVW